MNAPLRRAKYSDDTLLIKVWTDAFRVCIISPLLRGHLLRQNVINSAHVLSKCALRRHGVSRDRASPWAVRRMAAVLAGLNTRPGALVTICGPCAKYRQERDSASV